MPINPVDRPPRPAAAAKSQPPLPEAASEADEELPSGAPSGGEEAALQGGGRAPAGGPRDPAAGSAAGADPASGKAAAPGDNAFAGSGTAPSLGAEAAAVSSFLNAEALDAALLGGELARAFPPERLASQAAEAPAPRLEPLTTTAPGLAAQLRQPDPQVSGPSATDQQWSTRVQNTQQVGQQLQLDANRLTQQAQRDLLTAQPLLAQVWSEIYDVQERRLDQLTALRLAFSDSNRPPEDEEERARRDQRVGAVTFGSMHDRRAPADPSDAAGRLEEDAAEPLQAAAFAAAMRGAMVQNPQLVLRMFASPSSTAAPAVRLFVARQGPRGPSKLLGIWQPLQDATDKPVNWQRAAAGAFAALQKQREPTGGGVEAALRQALEALTGGRASAYALPRDPAARAEQLLHVARRASAPEHQPALFAQNSPSPASSRIGALVGTFVQPKGQQVVHVVWAGEAQQPPQVAEVPLTKLAATVDHLVVGRLQAA